ncbi:uncharacterized protein LOC115669177 [Syzygium oleosum]|uniref:uncharacterized protein LOC115669177 n=1 Tax=Syzygium oleosum TaxID=219896 RepID=UPI0024BAF371|nr:uncharacterized protein LOC115669177 [Syzygium oleosum]
MADSLEISKTTLHSTSFSLPSRSHPLATAVEELLQRLNSSDATSSSPASSAPRKLGGLKDLYDCIDDWLQMALNQQALSHEHHRSSMEELLDRSLKLLDVCGNVKDIFSQTKECIQELESSFRRRRRGNPAQSSEVETYKKSRKRLQKMVAKLLDHLKKMERKNNLRKHTNPEATLSILREAEEISLTVFESLLHVLLGPRERSKPIGWSLVSNMLSPKHISCDEKAEYDKIEGLDVELTVLKSAKDANPRVCNVSKRLEALESSIQEIEKDLECIYRRLVKTRAALLNIINYYSERPPRLFQRPPSFPNDPTSSTSPLSQEMDQYLSEASLTILDACGTSKEVILLVKEHIQDVRFSLRRAPSGELGNESPVAGYYPRRKKLKKVTVKCLRSLKGTKDKFSNLDLSPVNHTLNIVPEVLREVRATVIAVVESLSSLVSVPWLDRRLGKGFGATKLMFSSSRNPCSVWDVTILQDLEKRLEECPSYKIYGTCAVLTPEIAIDDLELELDSMFRRLIQTRVSLLNILSY